MSNAFSKEERVAFEDLVEGFNDALVLSRNVSRYVTDQTTMERANNIMWRPQPYIAQSFSGMDQSLNFKPYTQLSVPVQIGFSQSVPWTMNAQELRDALQEGRLGDAAKQKLASDINLAIMRVAALQGTLVIKRTSAASGFDDIAQCDTIMNEQGVQQFDRYAGLSSRDYNLMANNLSSVSRSFGNPKSDKAYERAFVGPVASFDTYKFDYAQRLPAAAGGGGLTINTLVAGANFYTPRATSQAATGETANVDNRYQTVTFSSTAGVVAGDAFTIGGVNAAHHITKGDTGQLKTFRVIQVLTGTTAIISPPIISNQGGTNAEATYQNVVVTPAAAAPIVFLNTVAAPVNVFWQKDALEIIPGRYSVPANAGAAIMRATTDQGIEIVLQKQYDIKTMTTFFRADVLFGVANKQPEMSGIMLFNQT